MPSKPNGNKWADLQMALAAISVTSVIAFWNLFAGIDKTKVDEKASVEPQVTPVPTSTAIVETLPPTPVPTMPPTGYKILFGGVAPQPQVIVVRKPGGGNNNTGGGNPSSDPVVTTTSSS
ncbi:MAG TPA: hypothetical protein PK078_14025 [Anaerolineales bacterium]|nr:hypothetical protein [Anaerolineales bacterium]HNB35251.1 hypothetical protein [Anaerolineales bacterium]